jgi:hypothetical protein
MMPDYMPDFDFSPKAIVRRRRATKICLARLLDEAEIEMPVDAIQSLAAGYHHTRFKTYLTQLFALFATGVHRIEMDTLLPVLQDVWNYFPHDSLDGRSPAEVMAEHLV